MSIYDTLNTQQKKAVFQTEGPVLILAGAGSGKTRVITHRIAYLMQECGVQPWNILAITFTNKAAGEMRERVDKLIGFGADSVWISTFHSLCARILRRYIDLIGYDNSFTIYDTDDQKRLMKDIFTALKIDKKQLKERTVLGAISAAKNELITPEKYREEKAAEDYYGIRIADAYDLYRKALKKNNALDFDDLLMLTVQLFKEQEDVLENYRRRFRYIMVDEYQDTNTAQFELVHLLAGKTHNLCVVGDDDQSIYKFRGANIRNILEFEKVYPEALVIRLEQNYRSTQNILDAANAVISHNVRRKKKNLWTDRGKGNPIHFRQFNSAYEEAAFVAQDIRRAMHLDPKLSYKDFAVLYRTNAQSRLLEEQFVQGSVPYNIVGGTNFYDRREIRDMISYLKTIANGSDDLAVRRILNVPRRGIGAKSIERVQGYAAAHDIGFFEALEDAKDIPSLGRAVNKIRPFVDMIHDFRKYQDDHSIRELMEYVLDRTGYAEELENSEDESAQDRAENIQELISKIVDYEDSASAGSEDGKPTLSGFLEEVSLVADIDDVDENDDRVLLMTLHSAKGLEFSHVYLTGMEDGLFPSSMSTDSGDPDDEEEERRLAYVGITRAKDDLTLTSARTRMIHGDIKYNPVSRFVTEIPADLMDEAPSSPGMYSVWDDDGEDIFSFHPESGEDDALPFGDIAAKLGNITYQDVDEKAPEPAELPVRKTARRRPKAVYVPPHTDESKKPFIARASGSGKKTLSSLRKGAPEMASAPDYGVGDRVLHTKFGEGTVLAIEKGPRDYKVTVLFDEYGRKAMYAAFAKLQKL